MKFDLLPADDHTELDGSRWLAVQFHLSEFQPARRVELIGDPPTAIRVYSDGGDDVAPALLKQIEILVGTKLKVIRHPIQ